MVSKDNADIVRDWLALDPRADWEATPDDFGEVVAALDALVAERDEARRLEFVRLGEAQQANELRLAAEAARDEALKRIALETQGMRDSRGGHMKRDPSYDALNREREEAFADAARWRARTHAAEADLADALHEAADMTAGQTAALARAEAAEAERDEAQERVKYMSDGGKAYRAEARKWAERERARAVAAEAEVARLREVLETSVGCWEEDARGWRDVLSYFNAQPDADRHDAKELIAAIEQRASTVAENANVARAALAPSATGGEG